MSDILVLTRDAWAGLADAPTTLRQPLLLWRKAVWFKANPRDAAYMGALLAEHWPGAAAVDVGRDRDWTRDLAAAREIVLLYPDAIGIGFGAIERRILDAAPRAEITVLTGRRRRFLLDRATRRGLLVRRFLERSMLLECLMGLGLLLATPVLLGVDLARGRR